MSASASTLEFRASIWRQLDVVGLVGLFTGVEVYGAYCIATVGWSAMVIASLVLFGAMLVGSLYYLLVPASLIRIAPEGVTFQAPLKTATVLDSEVEHLTVGRSGWSSFLTIKPLTGQKLIARIRTFSDRERVVALLNERYRDAESQAIKAALDRCHKFRIVAGTQLLVVLGVTCLWIGAALLSRPGDADRLPVVLTWIAGLLLVVVPLALPKSFIQVDPDKITRRTVLGTRQIRWNQIQNVKLTSPSYEGSVNELLWIDTPDGKIVAGDQQVDDFAFLRDIILSQVTGDKVDDQRSG